MASEDKEDSTEKKAGGSSTVKIIIIAILATVLIGGGLVGATLYFTGALQPEENTDVEGEEGEGGAEVEEEPQEPQGPPIYQRVDPKFVVSFRDQRHARFMQFSLQVMAREEDVIQKITDHMPAIRSSLIMLFDIQDQTEMATREGKQALLDKVVIDINETLKEVYRLDELEYAIEEAYFTEFVIQ